jgi:hypothetical protein
MEASGQLHAPADLQPEKKLPVPSGWGTGWNLELVSKLFREDKSLIPYEIEPRFPDDSTWSLIIKLWEPQIKHTLIIHFYWFHRRRSPNDNEILPFNARGDPLVLRMRSVNPLKHDGKKGKNE